MYNEQGTQDNRTQTKQKVPMYYTIKFWVGIFILLIGIIVMCSSFEIIQTGEKGVVLRMGNLTRTMEPGLNWKIPLAEKVITMNVKTQIIKSSEKAASNDMQDAFTEVAVNFNILDKNVKTVFIDVRNEYAETYVIPYIQESVKAVTAQYTAEELITKRADVKAGIDENLKLALAKVNLNVTNISITDFSFSTDFSKAIEDKVVEEQKALAEVNITKQEEEKKKQQILKAEAIAAKTRLEAQALAVNNNLIDKILAEAELKKAEALVVWAEQWGGIMPTHMYANTPVPIVQTGQ